MACSTTRCPTSTELAESVARSWGFWTRGKLQLLEDYLDAFTTAAKRMPEIIYLDLFAGEPENVDKHSDEPLRGSPRIALSVNNAPFTRIRLFELGPNALALQNSLAAEFPGRDLIVYEGDCNKRIHEALGDLLSIAWAPTFAFIDPNGPDYRWTTLEALASFKVRSRYKTEMWILFPVGMFTRLLPTDGAARSVDKDRITGMFGTRAWSAIYDARLSKHLTPGDAREEYLNLMRWRLENELGYEWTHPFEVKSLRGHPLYHLVFATDSPAGNRIMSDLYGRAAAEFPDMRQEAIDRIDGVQRLFQVESDPIEYRYEPPHPPFDQR